MNEVDPIDHMESLCDCGKTMVVCTKTCRKRVRGMCTRPAIIISQGGICVNVAKEKPLGILRVWCDLCGKDFFAERQEMGGHRIKYRGIHYCYPKE